jgi:hypothetical protein
MRMSFIYGFLARYLLGFYPGGTRRKKQGLGLPGSFATRREACLTKAGAGKDRGRRNEGRVEFEGEQSCKGEQS